MPLRPCPLACLAVAVLWGTAPDSALADFAKSGADSGERPWLRVAPSLGCTADEEWLAERIEQQLVGRRSAELELELVLRDVSEATVLEVSVVGPSAPAASTRVVAPTCEEALQAGIVIAALALGSEPPARAQGSATAPPPGAPEALGEAAQVPQIKDVVRPPRQATATRTWSAHMAMGADVGTLPAPSPVLAAGLSAELASGSLRALVVYGVPTTQEEVTLDLERTRSDFAAIGSVYCRNIDAGGWLSTCGGLDGRLVRVLQTSESANEMRREVQRWQPILSAVAQVVFAARADDWRPELELTAEVPLASSHRQSPVSGRGVIGIGIDL